MGNIFKTRQFSKDQIRDLLLTTSFLFLFVFSLALTISPLVRNRSWSTSILWSHWVGFIFWGITYIILNNRIKKYLPDSDPYIFSITTILTGWGILTIWRLIPSFGVRQIIWFLMIGLSIVILIRYIRDIDFLRKYKYIWLFIGLLVTALTLLFGVNPMGGETRLWLGCCGVYFQPSEPLKLLFIVFLAAYFADQLPLKLSFLSFFIPSLIVTSIALLILIFQKDLGTALIFTFLYTTLLFVATGKKRVFLFFLFVSSLSTYIGYFLFDVVKLRIDAWVNPWIDPSGRSYQIVQSIMAIANGGLIGRGPGGGSPSLVPVAISDFIFTSISEEAGLIGTIALISMLGLIFYCGFRITFQANNRFKQFLAFGITTYITIQSLLIIGGNIRLLPLTGVTLPFVSYGGSSLLTSYIGLIILLLISNQSDEQYHLISNPKPYIIIGFFILVSIFAATLINGWWAVYRSSDLLTRSDNARRSVSDLYVMRGSILSRNDEPINVTEGSPGNYIRRYLYPELSPIVGYTNPIYGQAGLESSLDEYLRGLSGQSSGVILSNQILYGQPPPGLDVRLSIDFSLQTLADDLLNEHQGAIVLLNAASGEVLSMASHPYFNPNYLNDIGSLLSQDISKPLLNRVTQGIYPIEGILKIFLLPEGFIYNLNDARIETLFADLGFYTTPEIRLPTIPPYLSSDSLLISPLQMALASASLSNDGIRPSPRLAIGLYTPQNGWVILPSTGDPVTVYSQDKTKIVSDNYQAQQKPFWEFSEVLNDIDSKTTITWYVAGTLFDWNGTPLTVTVLLEESNSELAREIGQKLLISALESK